MTAKHGDGWWRSGNVPESVRNECEKRATGEGNKAPPHAYMDILHHKKVWKVNWDVFVKVIAASGENSSKEQGTKFFGRLNEIRKLAMHPTKQVISQRPMPTDLELETLRNSGEIVARLVGIAKRLAL